MNSEDIDSDEGKVDRKIIRSFANKINVQFPDEYIDLLENHNCLVPEKCFFSFHFKGSEDQRDINFLGYGETIKTYDRIDLVQVGEDEYGWKNVVVFGISANGDYVCFDYRDDPKTNNPPIIVMFHDYFDDNNKMVTVNVADDFKSFIDSLEE